MSVPRTLTTEPPASVAHTPVCGLAHTPVCWRVSKQASGVTQQRRTHATDTCDACLKFCSRVIASPFPHVSLCSEHVVYMRA